eukprot:TRINITY_DN18361_c0_g1_i2.p1 TRINITY_DN18361_c0_g1~~TRINITY_DN18361_c0_g1_i2.p1  ORF type:complete len:528 (+),score=119.96 TRINITY_DN18361_c0_g1_i2:56-1639(+)
MQLGPVVPHAVEDGTSDDDDFSHDGGLLGAPSLPLRRQTPKQKFQSCMQVGVLLLGLLILLILVISLMAHMEVDDRLEKMKDQVSSLEETVVKQSTAILDAIDKIPSPSSTSSGRPSKHAIPYSTPVESQGHRGTCYIFATIGCLMQSYRKQGVSMGFLNSTEYLQLNEQAYGASLIKFAKDHAAYFKDTPQPDGKTDDGYVFWLYAFREYLKDKILPTSVCPYFIDEGHDDECPGMEDAWTKNPLLIDSVKVTSLYDPEDIKMYTLRDNAMSFSIELTEAVHYLPCDGTFAQEKEECKMCQTPCPSSLDYGTSCCYGYRVRRTPDGSFYSHHDDVPIGGHAMQLVGYNDNFREPIGITGNMAKGGFILRNSWGTSTSHSLNYYMQQQSSVNEEYLCPNTNDPMNWVWCPPLGVDMQKGKERTILECKDTSICGAGYLYCLRNMSAAVDDTVKVYLARWNETEEEASSLDISIPSVPLTVLSNIFTPTAAFRKDNDPNACGCMHQLIIFSSFHPFLQQNISFDFFAE